jgi:hypothetical protein
MIYVLDRKSSRQASPTCVVSVIYELKSEKQMKNPLAETKTRGSEEGDDNKLLLNDYTIGSYEIQRKK